MNHPRLAATLLLIICAVAVSGCATSSCCTAKTAAQKAVPATVGEKTVDVLGWLGMSALHVAAQDTASREGYAPQ